MTYTVAHTNQRHHSTQNHSYWMWMSLYLAI